MKKFKLSWVYWISLFFYFVQFPNLSTAAELTPEARLAQMSLEQKVGQLFIIGFPQTEMDQKLKTHLQKNNFSSFLLFKRNIVNPKQIVNLNTSLHRLSQENTGSVPLIAVDQEGGFVNRIPLRPSVPHAISLGLSRSTSISYSLGDEIGRILSSLGFNMNLAPVLDLADIKRKSFIGVRSFGSNPTWVAQLGSAYSMGLLKNNVIPTAKHFPGLGDIPQDPHLVSIVRQNSTKELVEKDFFPFKTYAKINGEKAIMLSHMIYPQLDDRKVPASFSRVIIHNWLRQNLGFNGVIMTDDLHMKASTDSSPVDEGAVRALEAGVDMIMLSWSFAEQEKTVNRILSAYKSARLSLAELDEKVLRILRMKMFIAQKAFSPTLYRESIISSSQLNNIEYHLFKTKLDQLQNLTGLAKDKQICVYSSQNLFATQMRIYSKIPLRTFQIHPHLNASTLERSLQSNACQLNILTLYNWSQAQLAVNLPASIQKHILVVNFSSVAFLRDSTEFLARLEALSPYSQAGRDLALFLNEKVSTSLPAIPSPLGLAQSHGVGVQNSRHPSSQKPISARPD